MDDLDSLYVISRTDGLRWVRPIPLAGGEQAAGLAGSLSGAEGLVVTGDQGSLVRVAMSPSGPTVALTRQVGRPIVGSAATVTAGQAAGGAACFGFATADGWVYLVSAALEDIPGFPVRVGDSVSASPAFADLNGDGSRDIVVFSGRTMHALSASGSSLDFFPVTLTGDSPLASNPVVADIGGTGVSAVLGVTLQGLVVAHDAQGRSVYGFPLLAGRGPHTAAVIARTDSVFVAVASSGDGSLSLWRTGSRAPGRQDAADWAQYQGDADQGAVRTSAVTGAPVSTEYFPPSRAYNWPNPAYDDLTYIRYFVGETSTVRIRVFDQAGDLVQELSGPGVPGVDNEIAWDVRNVQSGVYFARIEAQAAGKSGSATVTIAVVK
jgi:hypothetical protein